MYFILSPGVGAVADPLDRREWGGMGRLAGDLPQGDQDGRAKIVNVPAHVEITILESSTYWVVARTVSKSDGTWEMNADDFAFFNSGI